MDSSVKVPSSVKAATHAPCPGSRHARNHRDPV